MHQAYFITGTDTEIGKTHVAVTLIQQWQQQGLRVAAMKPVASGAWQDEQGIWRNDDVERLIAATGQTDRALLNPYCFPSPISPHLAAREAGVQIDLKHLVDCYRQLAAQADVVVVEGAGGWLAPLTDELDMADLALALAIPVVLVVGMRLGCINHARLTAAAIAQRGAPFAGWIANRVVPQQLAYQENLATLQRTLPVPMWQEIPFSVAKSEQG